MRPVLRSCLCGVSSGQYLEDGSTVEQTRGTVSIALNNHDLRDAVEVFRNEPAAWHPLMVFRAYLNPHSETDVVYVDPIAAEKS